MPTKPRYRRWTADTETAFLMALRVTGSVTKACAEIGRSTSGAFWRRQQHPAFDARYHQVLDEWQAEQTAERRAATGADDPGVMPTRVRYDGFTPIRQRAFLRALTETGSIKRACKRAGLSKQAALRARCTFPAFAAAWDRAETHCEADLEQIAIERAIDGVEEQVLVGGQLVTRVRYPEGLMTKMIEVRARRTRDERRTTDKGLVKPIRVATKEETDELLLSKLKAIEGRLDQDRNRTAAAQWRAWQASWGNFGRGEPLPLEPEDEHVRWVRGPGDGGQEVLPPLTPDEEDEGEALPRV